MSETQLDLEGVPRGQRSRPVTVWPSWFYVGKNTPAGWRANVAAGRHPFGAGLGPVGRRCGECEHAETRDVSPAGVDYGALRFKKCAKARQSRGLATDLRVSWRACVYFAEEGAPTVGGTAGRSGE